MNSKIYFLISVVLLCIVCSGCHDTDSQNKLNTNTNEAAVIESFTPNDVANGEFIDDLEAEVVIKSDYKIPDVSYKDLNIYPIESKIDSPQFLKSNSATCMVDFNSSLALTLIADQAAKTFAVFPYYIQTCNAGDFFFYSEPVNLDHFHLMYEHGYCFGSGIEIGINSNGECISQKEAKFWPRFAANMNKDTGIRFYAKSAQNKRNNFNLEGIKVLSGEIEVLVYRTDVEQWWIWRNLTVGSWYWTINNKNLSDLYIYYNGRDGTYEIDDLEVTMIR